MTSKLKSGTEQSSKNGASAQDDKVRSRVFVFGSNETGRSGAGAALYAVRYKGAIYGKGFGHYGNSFAIPTKDKNIVTLPLSTIRNYINKFIDYAAAHSELEFQVTQVGCGLAGLKAGDIAPMFENAPGNCLFDDAWFQFLGDAKHYWGTF